MNWYYEKNEEPQGPFYLEEILPVITPDTLVWRANSLEDWVSAKDHPLLFVFFENNTIENSSLVVTTFDVILVDAGKNKLAIIRLVKDIKSNSLIESKNLVDSTPIILKQGITKEDAEAIKQKLIKYGAKVDIQKN